MKLKFRMTDLILLKIKNGGTFNVYVAIAIYHEAPISDYIMMGIFLPIVDVAFLVFGSLCFGKSGNECMVIQLPDAVDDDELPKLK